MGQNKRMSRFRVLAIALLLAADCSDSRGRLTAHCLDQTKEDILVAEAKAANAFADKQLAPYRAALKAALTDPPHTGASTCGTAPSNKDWAAIAQDLSMGQSVEPGLTFVPAMYIGTNIGPEEAVYPSRFRAASATFTPRDPLGRLLTLATCPDYAGEMADWARLATTDFWTYEIVVVDDGNAGRIEIRPDPTGKAKESRAPSWCVAETKPPASSVPSASAAPSGEASTDGFPPFQTRCGRIFAYDYAKKAVTCFAHFTMPYPSNTLSGDGAMNGALLVVGIAAIRGVE
jgi:hypothetical protein